MLLEVEHLKKYFHIGRKVSLKAVDDVSFSIAQGETLGLVGESGCGKTTLGRTIIGLYPPTSGTIRFDRTDIGGLTGKQKKALSKDIQMIFQDPYASLNPRMTIGDIVGSGLDIHHICSGQERQDRIYQLLDKVGLNREHGNRFPHEFSGGQRQRVGIARALAIQPKLIICDEPISALDVSIQAQVVNLLEDLRAEMQLTYLFIAHDIRMVEHISDRIAVMYLGSIMELGNSHDLMAYPRHPYTKALLSAVPFADPDRSRARKRIKLEGDVPSPISTGAGCKFQKRCPYCSDLCRREAPLLTAVESGRWVACHHL